MTLPTTNKVAVIVGGSRGIGFEAAKHLASRGWEIALCSRGEDGARAARELSDIFQRQTHHFQVDVADARSVEHLAQAVSKHVDHIDALVFTAGILGPVGPLSVVNPELLEYAVNVNFTGFANSVHHFWQLFLRSSSFRIIALAGGGLGGPGQMSRAPAYVPSKAALASLVEILAEEVGSAGGTINAISPGNIPTSFMDEVIESGEGLAGEILYRQAVERVGKSVGSSIAPFLNLIDFLLEPTSTSVSGRFLSAKWDEVEKIEDSCDSPNGNEMYRLRRIDNDLYGIGH